MHAGGRKQYPRMHAREQHRRLAARQVGAGDQHLRDAGSARTRDHRVAIAVKTVVRQIDADVDPLHAPTLMPSGDA